ncbi:hypothetical protein H4582DRAFT_1976940 [Lactarius indigo]|nr:hypothetical protein H4582DRAFT_1976940 [Lactarius indigo]
MPETRDQLVVFVICFTVVAGYFLLSVAGASALALSSQFDKIPLHTGEPSTGSDDDKADVERKRPESSAASSSGSEPTETQRISAGEGMSNIAASMESAAETLAGALTDMAKNMSPAPAPDATLVGALTGVVDPILPPAPSDTASATDIRTAAMNMIEDEEGLSDNDVACAASCIVANTELARAYIAIKSRGARTALIQGAMERLRDLR